MPFRQRAVIQLYGSFRIKIKQQKIPHNLESGWLSTILPERYRKIVYQWQSCNSNIVVPFDFILSSYLAWEDEYETYVLPKRWRPTNINTPHHSVNAYY